MDEPKIAGRKSIKLELEPGTYAWCACGHSANQPFCDGSHNVTPFKPLKFSVEEKKLYSLCSCKRTKIPPYCDNAHREIPENLPGEFPKS